MFRVLWHEVNHEHQAEGATAITAVKYSRHVNTYSKAVQEVWKILTAGDNKDTDHSVNEQQTVSLKC